MKEELNEDYQFSHSLLSLLLKLSNRASKEEEKLDTFSNLGTFIFKILPVDVTKYKHLETSIPNFPRVLARELAAIMKSKGIRMNPDLDVMEEIIRNKFSGRKYELITLRGRVTLVNRE